jgi:hypothetical protein
MEFTKEIIEIPVKCERVVFVEPKRRERDLHFSECIVIELDAALRKYNLANHPRYRSIN